MRRLLPFALLLAGCGGLPVPGGEKTDYSIMPGKATVAPGGALDLEVIRTPALGDFDAAVREGARGGSVAASASGPRDALTYTAPATPGKYHVDVRFLDGTKVEGRASATIVVEASS